MLIVAFAGFFLSEVMETLRVTGRAGKNPGARRLGAKFSPWTTFIMKTEINLSGTKACLFACFFLFNVHTLIKS